LSKWISQRERPRSSVLLGKLNSFISDISVTCRPASTEPKNTMRLFDAGVSMARINISHGTLKSNLKLINKLKIAKRLRPHKTIGLMIESRGREIRLNQVSDKSGVMNVKSGTVVALNCTNPHGITNPKTWYCNCDVIQRFLKPNDVVYFDDGKVVCIVLEISNEGCMLEVKIGGPLKSNSQIRFVGGKHKNLPLLNPLDVSDLQSISSQIQIDYFVVPFASTGNDIK
jgi:pyruvate kinase